MALIIQTKKEIAARRAAMRESPTPHSDGAKFWSDCGGYVVPLQTAISLEREANQLRKLCDELAERLGAHDSCYHLTYEARAADHAALTAYNQFKKGTP